MLNVLGSPHTKEKADHKGNICSIWTRWLFFIGLSMEFTSDKQHLYRHIYISIVFVLSDQIFFVIDVLHLHENRWWCKVSSISSSSSSINELFCTCYCSYMHMAPTSLNVYNLFTSRFGHVYAIRCLGAKFYRLLVVSFMGWNSVQVRDALTFLFACPRAVLGILVRRMAWVARTLFLLPLCARALPSSVRHITTHKGTTTLINWSTHLAGWRRRKRKNERW